MSTQELKEEIQRKLAETDNTDILSRVLKSFKEVEPALSQNEIHPEFNNSYDRITKRNDDLLKKLAQ